jgi:hypothetical protein
LTKAFLSGLKDGQLYSNTFFKNLGLGGALPIQKWINRLDKSDGHVAITYYPQLLENLYNEVHEVAEDAISGQPQ